MMDYLFSLSCRFYAVWKNVFSSKFAEDVDNTAVTDKYSKMIILLLPILRVVHQLDIRHDKEMSWPNNVETPWP
jgi:hypothetical protein